VVDKPRLHVLGKKKKLEQDLAHISQEMYKRNAELASTNRTLSLLRTIDTLVLQSHDSLKVLCGQVSQAIIKDSDYPLVAIFVKESSHSVLALHGWSVSDNFVLKDIEELQKILEVESLEAKVEHQHGFVHLDAMSDAKLAHSTGATPEVVTELRTSLPVKSLYASKLMVRQKQVGLMVFGFLDKLDSLRDNDQALIERLSDAVGVAVDSKLLFEENQRVLGQLQKTNQKLRELDEAKDEFISMASHQLRTPLTTVKGYVSMVLEGDAGKVQEPQRKLLDQAFLSSQRMVYLIADLLNVSRLRTGKFVIDAAPTNLADVVEGEIRQLKETAKSRNLEMTYNKPKDFPNLMLDDTKIRQVIMNFADNAVYYTPSGGHISVNLVEKPESVEFTVVDDGIGVPKAEQHHMFSKFYRAGNAKKARPDGTGLGLFMAQKVIVAQGGAIIFRSEEGKGSTFGFSFSKEKLKVPAHIKATSAVAKGEPAEAHSLL